MRVSVISPVKNEVEFIGQSVMAVLPYVHEILYGIAPSDDGTEELLTHIQEKYAKDKLKLFWGDSNGQPIWDFDPMNIETYNRSYNYLVEQATGDAIWFLHPDMIVTNPEQIADLGDSPLAWFIHLDSFARDLHTKIVSGRNGTWKNMHRKKFGLHYYGGYGSQNEDFYHRDITGNSHRFYGYRKENGYWVGPQWDEYPFEIADSGIKANHYCETKSFARRLEKMKRCLKTQYPELPDSEIDRVARIHPRVTLDPTETRFGRFEFSQTEDNVPDVFKKYDGEFAAFNKKKDQGD